MNPVIGKLYCFDHVGCRYVGRLERAHPDGRYDIRVGATNFENIDVELTPYESQDEAATLRTDVKELPVRAARLGTIIGIRTLERRPLYIISMRDPNGRLIEYGPAHRLESWTKPGQVIAEGETFAYSLAFPGMPA